MEKQIKINSVRILPMSEYEFTDYADNSIKGIQNRFFKDELRKSNGKFLFVKKGILIKKTEYKCLVLFQYKKHVIASAILNESKRDNPKKGYKGTYYFDSNTIEVFNPIGENRIKTIWKQFKKFNQAKRRLDPKQLHKLTEFNQSRYISYLKNLYQLKESIIKDEDDLFQTQVQLTKDTDGSETIDKPLKVKTKKRISIFSYPRDPRKAKNSLKKAEYKCEINNNHKTFIARLTNQKYTEAHHIIPIELQDKFNQSLDVEANIASLCSTCHNQIHKGLPNEIIKMIKLLYKKRVDRLEICKINTTKNGQDALKFILDIIAN